MTNIRHNRTTDIDLDLADHYSPASGVFPGCAGVQLTVDSNAVGKQHGHLQLSAVAHARSPYQIRIPVCIIKGHKPGPVITLLAGLHGDEYEGTLTLQRLARQLTDEAIHGTLYILPCLNTHGMKDGKREILADGLNLDYAFPGNQDGSCSERLAFAITRHFIKPSDLVIDLRSGGQHLQFIPSAAVRFSADAEQTTRCESAMIAFGAPNSLRLPASAPDSCLQGAVNALGKDYLQAELGGGGVYGPKSLDIACTGCLNVLRHKAMLKDDLQLASTRLLEVRDESYYVHASTSGLYEPLVYLGENVWKEQAMANIVSLTDTRLDSIAVHTPRNATMIASHPGGFVNEGDLLAILAEEVQS
ncbi:MAG: succinylglutamate desuccinylase/aspartoacylase family protein [Granulosicoccus sp.]